MINFKVLAAKSGSASLLLIFASCALNEPQIVQEVMQHPEKYVGKDVEVCGYLMDGQIIASKEGGSAHLPISGLSILNRGILKKDYRNNKCIVGKIKYLGCYSDKEIVCVGDAYYDFAIDLSANIND